MAIERVKVTGVKFYKGNIEGNDIDSGKVYIEEMLDFTTGRAKGYATMQYSLADSAAAQGLMHNEFPLVCDVDFMRVTNGEVTKTVVSGLKPVSRGASEKAA